MAAKNDPTESRPLTPASADETPKKKTAKSASKSAPKASVRKNASSKSAASEASEATEKPAAKPRRSTRKSAVAATDTSATNSAPELRDESETIAPSESIPYYYIEEEVRVRAYMLSLARGDRPGSPDTDWFQAEREVALSRQI